MWFDYATFYHFNVLTTVGAPPLQDHVRTYRLTQLEGWLPYLQEMGFDAIYLGPVFSSLSHGYDTTDYYQVDERLGDNQSLVNFIHCCHEKNIRVIVDAVFNHTGREFFAYKELEKYRCWYQGVSADAKGILRTRNWRGCSELAVLDGSNQEVRDYLLEVVAFWKKTFKIDGIRLDCADCLNLTFLSQLRQKMKALDSEFFLLGEVIHGPYNIYVNDSALDAVTNYELHKALYSSHNDLNLFELAYCANREFGEEGIYRNMNLYNFVDNHDVDRLASKIARPEHIKNIYTLLFFMKGIPSIYEGSEWAMEGRKNGSDDSPLRPMIPSTEAVLHTNLQRHIQGLIRTRKALPFLSHATYKQLALTSTSYAFLRSDGKENLLLCENADTVRKIFSLSLEGRNFRQIWGEDCQWSVHEGQFAATVGKDDTLVIHFNT